MDFPEEGMNEVEILVNGKWIPATYYEADYLGYSDDGDDIYWFDYFCDRDGNTYPENIHNNGPYPEWRPLSK